jgi:hypothetical protein
MEQSDSSMGMEGQGVFAITINADKDPKGALALHIRDARSIIAEAKTS